MIMARCSDGHETQAHDFCDQCGMPVVETSPEPAPGLQSEEMKQCPNCSALRHNSALFCESCGYDYTTGALPPKDLRTELGLPPSPSVKADPAPEAVEEATPTPEVDQGVDEEGTDGVTESEDEDEHPTGSLTKQVSWVAEIWVDPQWYAFQESTDPLPPQGPPRIVVLKDSALIGRRSVSRNIFPDIDCELDVGCSRRQAYLTSADGYWYINDLDSANGTYVAPATDSLPDEPIESRTQISSDMRIYVGAWTRIVVRPAIHGELG